MNELHLFAGAGGGILAGAMLGHRCVCAVESEPYAQSILVARQDDGTLPPFPIFPDVCTFDGRAWRGVVDVVSGGFPCQDISVAGKGAGLDGERSGLWSEFARIIGEVRPRFVFVENSPALVTRGLGRVLSDLAALGYDCRWTVLGAADVGAPHQRDRFWLVATDTLHGGQRQPVQPQRQPECSAAADAGCDGEVRPVADADGSGLTWQQREACAWETGSVCRCGQALCHPAIARLAQRQVERGDTREEQPTAVGADRRQPVAGLGGTAYGLAPWLGRLAAPWPADWEDGVPRVATGVPQRVQRLKAIGNGQVPLCAATAWRLLTEPAP